MRKIAELEYKKKVPKYIMDKITSKVRNVLSK